MNSLSVGPTQFLMRRRKVWFKPWTWRTKHEPVEGVVVLGGLAENPALVLADVMTEASIEVDEETLQRFIDWCDETSGGAT